MCSHCVFACWGGWLWVVSRELRLHGKTSGLPCYTWFSCVVQTKRGTPPCSEQLGNLSRLRRGLLVHRDPLEGTLSRAGSEASNGLKLLQSFLCTWRTKPRSPRMKEWKVRVILTAVEPLTLCGKGQHRYQSPWGGCDLGTHRTPFSEKQMSVC